MEEVILFPKMHYFGVRSTKTFKNIFFYNNLVKKCSRVTILLLINSFIWRTQFKTVSLKGNGWLRYSSIWEKRSTKRGDLTSWNNYTIGGSEVTCPNISLGLSGRTTTGTRKWSTAGISFERHAFYRRHRRDIWGYKNRSREVLVCWRFCTGLLGQSTGDDQA